MIDARKAYPSDVFDEELALVAPYLSLLADSRSQDVAGSICMQDCPKVRLALLLPHIRSVQAEPDSEGGPAFFKSLIRL